MKSGLVLLTLLALGACERSPGPTPASAPAAKPPAAAPDLAPNLSQAFHLAFGRAAPARRTVTEGETSSVYIYDPARLIPMDGGMALVSTARNLSDCHLCAGALAVHYLKRGPGGAWTVSGAWPELAFGNGFGAPPDWEVRQFGQRRFIQAEAGWTGQGYTCSSATLIELGPDTVAVRAVVPVHYDNEGAVGEGEAATVIDGRIESGPDGKLRVTYEGTKSGVVDYARSGERYAPVSGPVGIADC